MNGFIYKIINIKNNKVYIGKTLNSTEKRFLEHKKDSTKQENQKRPLYRAMQKYGIENFQIETIEEVPIELLSEREKYWIQYFNSYHYGYNATFGGDGKQLYDYEAIVQDFLNGKLVKELATEFECTIDTIGQALKLANIDSRKNYAKENSKKIVALDLKNNIIKEFESRKDAALWLYNNKYTKSTNIDNITAAIGRVANGKRNTAYGLKWKNI